MVNATDILKHVELQQSQREPGRDAPVSRETFHKEADEIFQDVSGYKLNWSRFVRSTFLLSLTVLVALGIAFLFYSAIWLLTNNSVVAITNEGTKYNSITPDVFMGLLYNMNFWFGFILLAFPIVLYNFTFLTYIYMLFDSRLTELVKVLSTNPKLNASFVELYQQRIKSSIYKDPSYRVRTSSKIHQKLTVIEPLNTVNTPPEILSPYQAKRLRKLVRKTKRKVMTELVEKLSYRMDGINISGYFFALILLQIIVGISFVLPTLEFTRLGVIGTNILTHSTGTQLDTSGYLSFWAVEWGIFGAFIYSFINLMERIPRRDVTPRYYLNVALRYVFAVALSSLFFLMFHQAGVVAKGSDTFSLGAIAAISFTVGMFPNRYFRTVTNFVDKRIGHTYTRDIPLESFTGMSASEATRLWEEGIDNVDQLADSSVQDLFKRTKFDPNRLKSLVGRAMLWKYVFGLDNMRFIVLDLENKKEEKIDEKLKYKVTIQDQINRIKEFPFTDIQSLCTYVFSKPLDLIKKSDIDRLGKELKKQNGDDGINFNKLPKETLLQVVFMSLYLQERLSFTRTEEGAVQTLKEEFGIVQRPRGAPR